MKHHPEVKLMRSDLTDTWLVVRERNGIITDKWPLDENSARQLEDMRTSYIAVMSAETEIAP